MDLDLRIAASTCDAGNDYFGIRGVLAYCIVDILQILQILEFYTQPYFKLCSIYEYTLQCFIKHFTL